jgi:hypothetical protein
MKAKVMLYKVRVKEASKILSVKDVSGWEKLDCAIPEYSDVSRLAEDEGMDDMSFSAIKLINISVN